MKREKRCWSWYMKEGGEILMERERRRRRRRKVLEGFF
jgi:ribosome-associated protein YbcJ (S4-like RNA binding protein)